MSRDLLDPGTPDEDADAVFFRVAASAVEVVPACDDASITIRRRQRQMATVGSSSEVAARCDALQYEIGEGPCMESVSGQPMHLSGDLARESRWPTWAPQAQQVGVRSVLSIQLSTDQAVIGALNMYSRQADVFDQAEVDLALVFTAHATDALASSRLVAGLRFAVDSRHRIGVAQGVLMQTYDLTMDQSFDLLRRYSSHRNVKLHDVAVFVVARRRLPEADEPVVLG